MLDAPDTLSMVSVIPSLCCSKRLRVIAERVDSIEQLQLRRLLRCGEIQRWLFCMAMSAESVAGRLRANTRLDA